MNDVRWVVDRRTNSKAAGSGMKPTAPVPVTEPAPTLTSKAGGQWVIREEALPDWTFDRPATTIVGSFSPDVVAAPGYRLSESRQEAEASVKVTAAEASVLQSFRADYPFDGLRPAPHVATRLTVEDHQTLAHELISDGLQRGVHFVVCTEGRKDNEVLQAVVVLDAVDVVHDLIRLRPGDLAVLRYERSPGEDVAVVDAEVGSLLPALVRVERITVEPPLLPVLGAEVARDGFAFAVKTTRLDDGNGSVEPSVFAVEDALVVPHAHALRGVLPVASFDVACAHVSSYRWTGNSRSKQFEQIGNAVPPLLALHVLSSVTGLRIPAAGECAA